MKTFIKLAICFTLCLGTPAYAVSTIVPNVPPPTPLAPDTPGGSIYTIAQSLGTPTIGNALNLFHSFSTFNIGTGDTVNFTSTGNFTNVIVSVTQGLSTIDGTLKSSIPGANFYFINPFGITFGANAKIDVPATFHVSTANKLNFADGTSFYAADPTNPQSTLSVAAPTSFGFLGGSNSSVTVTGTSSGSTLAVNSGMAFDIVANNINIGSSTTSVDLNAPSGEMRLVAFKGSGDVSVNASTLPAQNLLATKSGDIIINKNSGVSSPGGHVGLWGSNININNATVSADSTATSPGSVTVTAGAVNVIDRGVITTSTSGNAHAGNIDVNANILNIIGTGKNQFTGISSSSTGAGTAGSVTINSNTVNIVNAGSITSSAFASGNAGDISLVSKTMTIDGQKNQTGNTAFTGLSSSAVSGTGSGGTVTVASGVLNIQDGGAIRTATFTNSNAGATTVTANVLTINGQNNTSALTGISSRANTPSTSIGNAGTVVVNANSLKILNAGQISTATFTKGNAGTVTVNAGSIVLDGNASSISSGTRTGATGHTGDVNVTASQSIQLTNNSNISIQSSAISHPPGLAQAKSAITVTAPDISLTGSKITSAATTPAETAVDNAGDITVNFGNLLTLNSSFITTAANKGNGGTITINGGKAIYLGNSGFLTSVTGQTSNGGNINVNAGVLAMNTAVIQANAKGGSGGNINIFLQNLIASQNNLILGGARVLWQPNIAGLNVIQAASESGVSGTVNVNSPQFDISGSVSGLDTSGLVLPNIAQNPCESLGTRSSSLTRGSKGGIPVSESKAGFIPPAGALTKAKSGSEKSVSSKKIVIADAAKKIRQDYSCTPLSL